MSMPMVTDDQPLMPATEAAKLLDVSLADVYRLFDKGQLHAYRGNRGYLHVPIAEVEALATQ